MKKSAPWLMLLLIAPLLATAQERTVTASGVAAIDVAPDEASATLGVETFAEDLAEARRRGVESCSRLLRAARSLGVAEQDIATATLEVKPEYKEKGHAAKGLEGYFLTRVYTVKIRRVDALEPLVDAGS